MYLLSLPGATSRQHVRHGKKRTGDALAWGGPGGRPLLFPNYLLCTKPCRTSSPIASCPQAISNYLTPQRLVGRFVDLLYRTLLGLVKVSQQTPTVAVRPLPYPHSKSVGTPVINLPDITTTTTPHLTHTKWPLLTTPSSPLLFLLLLLLLLVSLYTTRMQVLVVAQTSNSSLSWLPMWASSSS